MPAEQRGAYVLAGGRSSRMGTDKALLIHEGEPMLARVMRIVQQAVGNATVVAPPGRYEHLGLRVVSGPFEGSGPLGGIHAALTDTQFAWNLVVACDMPALNAGDLARLLDSAYDINADVILPVGDDGMEQPLCALYRRSAVSTIEQALQAGERKILRAIAPLNIHRLGWHGDELFRNINTPGDWHALSHT